MFLLYILLPSARIRTHSAAVGALWAGTLWELAKHGFTLWVARYAAVDRFYGAMGGLVLVIFWSYLSALIVLLGAEVVECHAKWFADTPVTEDAAESYADHSADQTATEREEVG
jgi:YihY family inner membrane protein